MAVSVPLHCLVCRLQSRLPPKLTCTASSSTPCSVPTSASLMPCSLQERAGRTVQARVLHASHSVKLGAARHTALSPPAGCKHVQQRQAVPRSAAAASADVTGCWALGSSPSRLEQRRLLRVCGRVCKHNLHLDCSSGQMGGCAVGHQASDPAPPHACMLPGGVATSGCTARISHRLRLTGDLHLLPILCLRRHHYPPHRSHGAPPRRYAVPDLCSEPCVRREG